MPIHLEVDDAGVALITLDRPERLNALDTEMYELLSAAWTRVRDDEAIRVAVVTGAGDRSFTTGADVKDFLTARPTLAAHWNTQRDQLLNRGLEVWKPVVAAVNGYCLGGGMTLLMATDVRVAADHATFGLSEVQRGVIAGNGGTQRILEQLPHAIGMEMLLSGRRIDAHEAERWGLVNKVVAKEELMTSALDYAATIARNAPLAVQASKELALRARDVSRNDGLRMEQAAQRVLATSEDAVEGPAAFREKREPKFTGR